MMQPTTDVSKFIFLSGGNTAMEQAALRLVSEGRLVALTSDGGAMIFVRTDKPEEWKVSLAFDVDSRGAAAKDDINDGLAWMFVNTDAVEVIGTIYATNAPCLALVPYTHGGKAANQGETYRYTTTISRWADAIGATEAAAAFANAGRDEKLAEMRARGLLP